MQHNFNICWCRDIFFVVKIIHSIKTAMEYSSVISPEAKKHETSIKQTTNSIHKKAAPKTGHTIDLHPHPNADSTKSQ